VYHVAQKEQQYWWRGIGSRERGFMDSFDSFMFVPPLASTSRRPLAVSLLTYLALPKRWCMRCSKLVSGSLIRVLTLYHTTYTAPTTPLMLLLLCHYMQQQKGTSTYDGNNKKKVVLMAVHGLRYARLYCTLVSPQAVTNVCTRYEFH
jgi:hypothetical protein